MQTLCRDFLISVSTKEKVNIFLSGSVSCSYQIVDCIEVNHEERSIVHDELNSTIEEADMRIIPHVYNSIINGTKRVVVLSNDRDVVLLLYFMPEFLSKGVIELWVKYGTGNNERFIPIHLLANSIGYDMCHIILKAHILTGCDVTSKVGKVNALKANPAQYLSRFGENDSLLDGVAIEAENYLVKTIKVNTEIKKFDQLRYECHMSKKTTLPDLPPTSHSIQMHLLRCHFVVRQSILLLNGSFDEKAIKFGWSIES